MAVAQVSSAPLEALRGVGGGGGGGGWLNYQLLTVLTQPSEVI